jgi:hypothetical protein
MLGSSIVAAQSFDDVFNAQRAMYGKGHTFTFAGKRYTTDHPEELEAAAEATAENAKALITSAKALHAQARALGFGWTLTKGIIKSANQAFKAGDFHKAMHLAAQAKYHGRMGIVQYHRSQKEWIKAVPQ